MSITVEKGDFNPSLLKEKFVETYGASDEAIRIFASPARINIIGEHIDYNG
ncbi:MAG: galactokinase family protein, partial [Treponema sp.]|nr:galactokinase family protein [Treponema sp.]